MLRDFICRVDVDCLCYVECWLCWVNIDLLRRSGWGCRWCGWWWWLWGSTDLFHLHHHCHFEIEYFLCQLHPLKKREITALRIIIHLSNSRLDGKVGRTHVDSKKKIGREWAYWKAHIYPIGKFFPQLQIIKKIHDYISTHKRSDLFVIYVYVFKVVFNIFHLNILQIQ